MIAATLFFVVMVACSSEESTTATADRTATDTAYTATDTGAMATDTTTAGSLAQTDQDFMMKVATGGLAEVELGNLAQQNGESQEVKDFAKMMVDDHSKSNDELMQLASSKNVTLPTALDAEHQAMRDKLAALKGAAFDREYMAGQVADHEKTVADFQTASTSATEPQVKEWAAKSLPKLQKHLQKAKDIQGKLQ